ncbi:MAG TPA: hypothetical protein DCQ64_01475 [Candidatus Rokubacteria bacterium]|nr:hypothetical protein [Candidatus Rokubacteria bacterium]
MQARSFPYLLYELMRQHHQERVLRMVFHSGVPYTTLWRWIHGVPRAYTDTNLRRLCRAYSLKEMDVRELIHRDNILRWEDKPVPVPDLSHIVRGPVSRNEEEAHTARRRRRRGFKIFGGVLAGLSILTGGQAIAGGSTQVTPKMQIQTDQTAPYRRWRLAA